LFSDRVEELFEQLSYKPDLQERDWESEGRCGHCELLKDKYTLRQSLRPPVAHWHGIAGSDELWSLDDNEDRYQLAEAIIATAMTILMEKNFVKAKQMPAPRPNARRH
jgi:hypothetical protein